MKNKTKQTAVEILVHSLIKLGYLHSNEFGQSLKVTEVIKQAKEMEREQRIKDMNFGHSIPSSVNINYEAYFKLEREQ